MGRPLKFNDKEKWCAKHNDHSGAWLPLEQFGFRTRNRSGREDYCKECKKQVNRAGAKYRRKWHLKSAYGISEIRCQEMSREQNGKCALCKTKQRLNVDHNHTTGRVRRLLCNACNQALGLFKESPELLRAAANYLEEFSKIVD